MGSSDERVIGHVVYLVVKHNLGGLGGAIDDVDTHLHAIADDVLVVHGQLDQRCRAIVVEEGHVAQPELTAELLASVLEVDGIMSMPHHAHRVDLAETYFYHF